MKKTVTLILFALFLSLLLVAFASCDSNTEIQEYTVVWKNYDGSTLKSESVAYGTAPSYSGIPTKPSDAEYTYTFKGWDKTPSAVTGDVTYTAQFSSTTNKYTITWKNYDGTTLKTDSVEYGVTPNYSGSTPTKSKTAQYTYAFKGWDKTPSAVTGDVTYTAQFSSTTNKYTVTWKNHDGTTLKTDSVEYGATPNYTGSTPTKSKTAQYTYTFKCWDKTPSAVTGDITYTAQFTETTNKYTVTWKNWDGTVLETDIDVFYGSTPTYDGAAPQKAGTTQYTYTFSGWDKALSAVTGNATYTAQYSSLAKYTVTFNSK